MAIPLPPKSEILEEVSLPQNMKKCIVCGNVATLCVKDCSECYCDECADECFSDISLLQKVEDQAVKLKNMIDEASEDGNVYKEE